MIIVQIITVHLLVPVIMSGIPLFKYTSARSLRILFLIAFCQISTFSTNAQDSFDEALLKFEYNNKTFSREKIYIHFDKSNYLTGEDIWYKIYLVNGNTNRQEVLSEIVYVDLIGPDNKVVDSKTFKARDGCVEGDFKLDKNLIQGQYTVRAYTNYMRNFDAAYFFRKSIQIISNWTPIISEEVSMAIKSKEHEESLITSNVKPDVQFFPEGGNLVNNFINRVGFKAVGINGKGVDIKGKIVDEAGKKVSSISNSKFGMGDFSFIPILGKRYQAKIIYNNIEIFYDLPSAHPKGVLMNVVEYQDNYRIRLLSSLPEGTKNLHVIGSKNGEVICSARLLEDKTKTVVNISKATLESGIVQFTVIDSKGIPLCERLVFIEKEAFGRTVNIASSKKEYGKRELVELEISMSTIKKKSSKANMSVAITDVTFQQRDSLGLDIKSHLFLNSELKGEVEHPGYYFYSKDPRRKRNLDLLMMCQGWRQFIWNEHLSDSVQHIKYPIEQGFRITGNVKKYFNHNKAESATVSLMIRNKEEFSIDEILTNAEGYFEFGDFEFKDSTLVIIQTRSLKTKKAISKRSLENPKTNYFIELDTSESPEIRKMPLLSEVNYTYKIAEVSQSYDDTYTLFETTFDRIELEEVEVITYSDMDKYDTYVKNKQLYRNPSQRVDFERLGNILPGNVLQNLDGKIAGFTTKYINGVQVGYFTRTGSYTLRPPLYLLDGIPVGLEAIKTIPMAEVLFVDALKGPKALIYGSAGANGVIAVYTKDGTEFNNTENNEIRGIINFIHPGYSLIRKFYEPVYKTKGRNEEKPDNRITICWKPMVKLDKEGKAKISFYSADIATTYRVLLEGLTDEGEPIINESFISIE